MRKVFMCYRISLTQKPDLKHVFKAFLRELPSVKGGFNQNDDPPYKYPFSDLKEAIGLLERLPEDERKVMEVYSSGLVLDIGLSRSKSMDFPWDILISGLSLEEMSQDDFDPIFKRYFHLLKQAVEMKGVGER